MKEEENWIKQTIVSDGHHVVYGMSHNIYLVMIDGVVVENSDCVDVIFDLLLTMDLNDNQNTGI